MAEVAAIYDVAPFPRTVLDEVHDQRPARRGQASAQEPQRL